ncbi:hypothetical protein BDR03DRAFT_939981 [Suillus americanus]|nr:hypothetical protein BDR03DRAFT_939981 [Suillus americanus]
MVRKPVIDNSQLRNHAKSTSNYCLAVRITTSGAHETSIAKETLGKLLVPDSRVTGFLPNLGLPKPAPLLSWLVPFVGGALVVNACASTCALARYYIIILTVTLLFFS